MAVAIFWINLKNKSPTMTDVYYYDSDWKYKLQSNESILKKSWWADFIKGNSELFCPGDGIHPMYSASDNIETIAIVSWM